MTGPTVAEHPAEEVKRWLLDQWQGRLRPSEVNARRAEDADGRDAWYFMVILSEPDRETWNADDLAELRRAVRDKALEVIRHSLPGGRRRGARRCSLRVAHVHQTALRMDRRRLLDLFAEPWVGGCRLLLLRLRPRDARGRDALPNTAVTLCRARSRRRSQLSSRLGPAPPSTVDPHRREAVAGFGLREGGPAACDVPRSLHGFRRAQ
jgi:hypothetical protein